MSSSKSPYNPVRSNTSTLYEQFRSGSSSSPAKYPAHKRSTSPGGCSSCMSAQRELGLSSSQRSRSRSPVRMSEAESEEALIKRLEQEADDVEKDIAELEYLQQRSREKSRSRSPSGASSSYRGRSPSMSPLSSKAPYELASASPLKTKELSLEDELKELAYLEERARIKSRSPPPKVPRSTFSGGDINKTPPPVVRLPRSGPSSPLPNHIASRRVPSNSRAVRVLFPEETSQSSDLRSTTVLSKPKPKPSPPRRSLSPKSPSSSPSKLGVVINESHNPISGDFGVIREHEGVKHYYLNDQRVSKDVYLNALF